MDTVVFLIEHMNMDPVEDICGRNIFLKACQSGNTEIVKYLAEKYPAMVMTCDHRNNNGLHIAASFGKMDMVVFLIEKLNLDPAVVDSQSNIYEKALLGGDKAAEVAKYLHEKYPQLESNIIIEQPYVPPTVK